MGKIFDIKIKMTVETFPRVSLKTELGKLFASTDLERTILITLSIHHGCGVSCHMTEY